MVLGLYNLMTKLDILGEVILVAESSKISLDL